MVTTSLQSVAGTERICRTCKNYPMEKIMPPQSVANKLDIVAVPKKMNGLNNT